jgi:hypothetical protein
MSTLAAVAVRETALISGTGMFHGFAPGAIDGFAVGALATGACCLVIAAPRLLHRARLSAKDGMWGTGARRSKVRRDYFAAPADAVVAGPAVTAELFAPEAEVLGYPAPVTSDLDELPAGVDAYDPAANDDPFASVDGDDVVLPGTSRGRSGREQAGRSGHRSKHRITSSDADRRPDARRQPRHAAPSARLATKVSGKFAALPIVVRS